MYKALKIEIKLTEEQKIQVNKTIGTERFIYNEYIKYNQEQYELGNKFVSANDFSKYINNVYLPNNPDKKWIKEVSSKSVKQAMLYGEKAFKNFFPLKRSLDNTYADGIPTINAISVATTPIIKLNCKLDINAFEVSAIIYQSIVNPLIGKVIIASVPKDVTTIIMSGKNKNKNTTIANIVSHLFLRNISTPLIHRFCQ